MQLAIAQDALAFPHAANHSRSHFVIGDCNALAAEWIDRWPRWPGVVRGLIIHGEAGSGKSHLASIWAEASGAEVISELAPSFAGMGGVDMLDAGKSYVLDGVGAGDAWPDEAVFLCLEKFAGSAGSLLILAEAPPAAAAWRRADVVSRFSAMTTAPIAAPDDAVLVAVLQKLADDRGMSVDEGVVGYLIKRMERRFAAAATMVDALDAMSMRAGRRVTMAMARVLLNHDDQQGNLL